MQSAGPEELIAEPDAKSHSGLLVETKTRKGSEKGTERGRAPIPGCIYVSAKDNEPTNARVLPSCNVPLLLFTQPFVLDQV